MSPEEITVIVDAAWTRIKAQREPGFRAPGAERVFKAGMRWGISFGEDAERAQQKFDLAWRVRR